MAVETQDKYVKKLAAELKSMQDTSTGLTKIVTELVFDNEKVIKPTLQEIKALVSRDIYATKVDVAEDIERLQGEIKTLKEELKAEKEKTKNYNLVEKVVFGLVSLVVVGVVGGLLALVINKG